MSCMHSYLKNFPIHFLHKQAFIKLSTLFFKGKNILFQLLVFRLFIKLEGKNHEDGDNHDNRNNNNDDSNCLLSPFPHPISLSL